MKIVIQVAMLPLSAYYVIKPRETYSRERAVVTLVSAAAHTALLLRERKKNNLGV